MYGGEPTRFSREPRSAPTFEGAVAATVVGAVATVVGAIATVVAVVATAVGVAATTVAIAATRVVIAPQTTGLPQDVASQTW